MTSTAPATPVPVPVRRSVALWTVALALMVVSAVVGLFGSDPTGRVFDPARPFDAGDAVGVGFLVVVLGLIALFVQKMRAGRNWARIALLVVGLLFAASLRHVVDPVPDAVAVVLRVVDVLSGVLAVVAVVFSFRPAAAPHFARPVA